MKSLSLRSTLALACACSFTPAHADDFPIETFSGAPLSNATYSPGPITGPALLLTSGYASIGADPASGHGNYLDLFSGSYAGNVGADGIGSSTVRSVAAFDLLAGYTYTLSFDYSRQTFSAGHGPFDTALTGSPRSH